ncbi:MAG: deoxyribose-phosphate aldolase [Parcubacteria group bacterium]|nr:deoxyribose-phosphate aldolase [Parcubacteria group bacterium]
MSNIARYIDHTLLKSSAKEQHISALCMESRGLGFGLGFAAVCVYPYWVPLCARLLSGDSTKVCAVVGFPFGMGGKEAKALEAALAVRAGAQEIDMVINIGALKNGDMAIVEEEIREVRKSIDKSYRETSRSKDAPKKVILKVIIETCLLTREEKILACEIVQRAGADFVKTSTGFSTGGATVPDVRLIRGVVGKDFGVKASGGIKTYGDALAMIEAGANRIGSTASMKIIWREDRRASKVG